MRMQPSTPATATHRHAAMASRRDLVGPTATRETAFFIFSERPRVSQESASDSIADYEGLFTPTYGWPIAAAIDAADAAFLKRCRISFITVPMIISLQRVTDCNSDLFRRYRQPSQPLSHQLADSQIDTLLRRFSRIAHFSRTDAVIITSIPRLL